VAGPADPACCEDRPYWEESRFDSREQMFEEAYRVYKEASVGARSTTVSA
jgi:hypothetical protein